MTSKIKKATKFKLSFLAIFLVLVGFYIYDKNKDIQKNQESAKTENVTKSEHKISAGKSNNNSEKKSDVGDNFKNPIEIKSEDISNKTGEEFSKKYYGKWIKFDGVIKKTEDLQGMLGLQTSIKVGTIENNTDFKDDATLSIFANKNTFSKKLQDFSKKHTSTDPIQVKIVAKVAIYNKDLKRVLLMKNPNVEGEKPSIRLMSDKDK